MFYLIDTSYNFSTLDQKLHKAGLRLLRRPDNERVESKYKSILNRYEDKDIANEHDDNIQIRRDAIRLLQTTKKNHLSTSIYDLYLNSSSIEGFVSATIKNKLAPDAEVQLDITEELASYLINKSKDANEFNKAIRGIIKDYKKSLVNKQIKDAEINLRYEYPRKELKKIYSR